MIVRDQHLEHCDTRLHRERQTDGEIAGRSDWPRSSSLTCQRSSRRRDTQKILAIVATLIGPFRRIYPLRVPIANFRLALGYVWLGGSPLSSRLSMDSRFSWFDFVRLFRSVFCVCRVHVECRDEV